MARLSGTVAVTVAVDIDPDTIFAMSQSLASIAAIFAGGLASQEPLAQRLTLLADTGDIFDFQDSVGPAVCTEIVNSFRLAPTDGYVDLCAAIVRDGHADTRTLLHGWPILSLVADSASVTEAGGGATASGGGVG